MIYFFSYCVCVSLNVLVYGIIKFLNLFDHDMRMLLIEVRLILNGDFLIDCVIGPLSVRGDQGKKLFDIMQTSSLQKLDFLPPRIRYILGSPLGRSYSRRGSFPA